jgi:hypothetical protein
MGALGEGICGAFTTSLRLPQHGFRLTRHTGQRRIGAVGGDGRTDKQEAAPTCHTSEANDRSNSVTLSFLRSGIMTMNHACRRDRTGAITICVPIEDRQPIWPIRRLMVPILTLVFVLFPAVMAIPHHGPVFAPIASSAIITVQGGVREACPPVDLCVGAAVEQALPRLPTSPLLLLALVVLVLAMHRQHRAPVCERGWWWPPNRRRALLQVFLI